MRNRLPRAQRHGAAATAFLAALVLAGCGSDGSGNKGRATNAGAATASGQTYSVTVASNVDTSDKRTSELLGIQEALTAAFAPRDAVSACETHATANYVTTAFGDVDGCKAAISSGAGAAGVSASGFDVREGTASAVAVPKGGPSAGEKIHVTLVKDGATWKVDSAKSNAPVGP